MKGSPMRDSRNHDHRRVDRTGLLDEITRLPVGEGASLQVLRIMDDPSASARDIGAVVERDPALTMQMLRMANSPLYGGRQTLVSAREAVARLGFDLVRSLVVHTVYRLSAVGDDTVPPEFWEHSFETATVASLMADQVAVSPAEMFSMGLLLDLGIALLARYDAEGYSAVQTLTGSVDSLLTAEQQVFGISHADVSAAALQRLRFPNSIVSAVAEHHLLPSGASSPFTRTFVLADALAHEIGGTASESAVSLSSVLDWLGISAARVDRLVQDSRHQLESLSDLAVASNRSR